MAAGPHAHFRSPIAWHARLDEAQAEARALGRLVFVVHGKRTCAATRALVERTLSKEEIVELVRERFVPLASDVDGGEPALEAVIQGLSRREPTPLCIYLSPDRGVRHFTAGGRPPAVLINDMLEACARA